MVKVKLFGVFRLDSGVKSLEADVTTVKTLYPLIVAEAKRLDPRSTLSEKDLRGCIVAVNGRQVKPNTTLSDGDEVVLVPAVAGG